MDVENKVICPFQTASSVDMSLARIAGEKPSPTSIRKPRQSTLLLKIKVTVHRFKVQSPLQI